MKQLFPPIVAVLLAVACSGSSPTAPTSAPPPPPTPSPPPIPAPEPSITIAGTITDAVTGQQVGEFTQTTLGLPTKVTVSAPGYVTRETWVATPTPSVDLFPERGFDLPFYRQLTRDTLAGQMRPLWVLSRAPAFYMEVEGRKGLTIQVAQRLEATARRLVPLLTGGRFQVTRWETGPEPRPQQAGWIMIERRDESDACGRAYVGADDGQIWLNGDSRLCDRVDAVFAHELGHALGFFHVNRPGAMMFNREDWWRLSAADGPNEIERHHMALAYRRPRGNSDTDVDPSSPVTWVSAFVVD